MNDAERTAGLAPTPGYRYADIVGDQLFVAGQVPLDPDGNLIGDDPAAHTTACLDNLRTLVGVHGFAIDDLRHLTISVVGPQEHLSAAWEATVSWFGGEVPPATLVGVARLGYPGQLVEIDAIIVKRP